MSDTPASQRKDCYGCAWPIGHPGNRAFGSATAPTSFLANRTARSISTSLISPTAARVGSRSSKMGGRDRAARALARRVGSKKARSGATGLPSLNPFAGPFAYRACASSSR
jgi:hypothetical protein